jgi:hypothetical protein
VREKTAAARTGGGGGKRGKKTFFSAAGEGESGGKGKVESHKSKVVSQRRTEYPVSGSKKEVQNPPSEGRSKKQL